MAGLQRCSGQGLGVGATGLRARRAHSNCKSWPSPQSPLPPSRPRAPCQGNTAATLLDPVHGPASQDKRRSGGGNSTWHWLDCESTTLSWLRGRGSKAAGGGVESDPLDPRWVRLVGNGELFISSPLPLLYASPRSLTLLSLGWQRSRRISLVLSWIAEGCVDAELLGNCVHVGIQLTSEIYREPIFISIMGPHSRPPWCQDTTTTRIKNIRYTTAPSLPVSWWNALYTCSKVKCIWVFFFCSIRKHAVNCR